MTIERRTPQCLSADTLAALIDGRLPAAERAAAIAHAADCTLCTEAINEALSLIAALDDDHAAPAPAAAPAPVVRARRPVWGWAIAGLAAAALVVFAVGRAGLLLSTTGRVDRELAKLAAAEGPARPSVGRLGASFAWKPAPSPQRGAGSTESHPLAVDEAVVSLRRLAQDQRDVMTLRALGLAHLVEGRLDDAIVSLGDAASLDATDAEAHADLSAALLDRWTRDGQAADANRALDEADAALERRADYAPALFNRALALEALGLQPKAVEAWTRARDAESAGSPWRDEADQHLAKLKTAAAGASSAWFTLDQRLDAALDAWRSTPANAGLLASSIAEAARADVRTFRADLARAAVSSSADPARQACVIRTIASLSAMNRAFDASQYPEAHADALESLTAARCARVPTESAEGLVVWTANYAKLPAPDAASTSTLIRRSDDGRYWEVGARLRYLDGLAAVARAKFSDAIDAYREAQVRARRGGAIEVLASIDTALAEAERISGDLPAAWTSHADALALSPWLSPRRRHIVYAGAALSALHDHLGAAARDYAALVVENAAAWRNADGDMTGRLLLARAHLELGDTAAARLTIADADRRLSAVPDAHEHARYAPELAMVSGLIDVRDRPRDAMREFADAAAGFVAVGLLIRLPDIYLQRSRADRAAGDLDEARADLDKGLQIFEDQRPGSRDAQLRIDRTNDLWDLFSSLIDLDRGDPARALDAAERSHARALLDALAPTQTAAPLQGADLLRAVPHGAVALSYAVLPERLLVWTIADGQATLTVRDVRANDLRARVMRYVTALRRGDASADDARWLSAMLMPALPASAPATPLIVVPDDVLYGVPFGALTMPDGSAVITRFQPVVAPSLTILARVSARPTPSRLQALLVGYGEPRPALGLPALPDVATEIAAAASHYGAATVLIGASATPEAVRRVASSATVLHFAGHAWADETLPSESRLLLAPSAAGDALRAADIAQLPLVPGSTVVLSACETAAGRTIRGEGAMTIARPFLVAGASHVVAALWDVRDDGARALMNDLETALAAGASPAAALAQAQRHAAQTGRPAASWAAFEVIGGLSR